MIAPAMVLAAASLGPVVLRGAAEPDEREVLSIDQRGVELASPSNGSTTLLGWESIKLVLGDDAASADPFMQLADDAWRARARLLRGDTTLAAPLLETLAPQLKDVASPTALLVHAGLARVRANAHDLPGAVEAWSAAAKLHSQGIRLDPELAAALRFDETTGLITDLPVFWIQGSESVNANDLLRPMCAALSADPQTRNAARAELRTTLTESLPAWREAWTRAALGRSYLLEPDPDQKTLGLLELLHLPARFAADQPILTALALGEILTELRARKDTNSAAIIEAQLRAIDPRHPALRHAPKSPAVQGGGAPP